MLRVLANKTHQLIYSEKLFAFLVRELPLPASPVLSAWITVMRPGAVAAMFCHEVTSMRTKVSVLRSVEQSWSPSGRC